MKSLKYVSLLCLAFLVGCPSPPQPVQPQGENMDRVLIIGINVYPSSPLAGCVNDANNMKNYLLTLGIKPENIVVLLDGQARTTAILSKLDWLVNVPTGNRCFFHYSGHGAQVPDPNEPDGLAEVICPVDFDWTAPHMITDKEFIALFKRITPGVKFNWCSDSCHSGDLDRVIPKPGFKNHPRRMLPPPHIAAAIEKIKAAPHKKSTIRELLGGALNVGYVSACRSDQTAADTEVDGEACGAFTAYFLKAIRALPANSPLSAVVAKTLQNLEANGYDQVPQAAGPRVSVPLLQ